MLYIVILVAWYIYVQPTRQQRLAWYYSSNSTAEEPLLLLWNAILLVYNTLWITQSPFTETATPPPIAPTHGYVPGTFYFEVLNYTRFYSNPTAVFYVPEIIPCSLIRSTTTDFRTSQYSSTHVVGTSTYFLPGTEYFLFERSEFLIDTPHKKNLRVCPRARVK